MHFNTIYNILHLLVLYWVKYLRLTRFLDNILKNSQKKNFPRARIYWYLIVALWDIFAYK